MVEEQHVSLCLESCKEVGSTNLKFCRLLQASWSPFGSQSCFGQNNSSSNPFALKPFGSTTPFGSPIDFGGSSTGVAQLSSPFASNTAFSSSSSPASVVQFPLFGHLQLLILVVHRHHLVHIWFLNIFWCIISTSIWGFKNIAFGTSSTPFGTSSTPALGATGTPSFSFGSTQIGHSSAFGSSSPFGSTASPLGGQSSAFGEFKNHWNFDCGLHTPSSTFGNTDIGQSGFGGQQRSGSRVASYMGTTEADSYTSGKLVCTFGVPMSLVFGHGGGIFGSSSTSAFGTLSTPFGASCTPAFGASSTPSFWASTFGSTQAFSAFGLQTPRSGFGNTGIGQSGFGGQQQSGSRVASYTATTESKLVSISAIPIHKDKSHEQLRWEDYQLGDKANSSSTPSFGQSLSLFNTAPAEATSSPFGNTQSSSLFSSAAPKIEQTGSAFGQFTSHFGQTTPLSQSSLFSSPSWLVASILSSIAASVALQAYLVRIILDSRNISSEACVAPPDRTSSKDKDKERNISNEACVTPPVGTIENGLVKEQARPITTKQTSNGSNEDHSPQKADSGHRAGEDSIVYEHEADAEVLMPKLRRSDYCTLPRMPEPVAKERAEPGFCCHVEDFMLGRQGYGSIRFLGETDVRGQALESLVQFNTRGVIAYMDNSTKPPVGQGLNKLAEGSKIEKYKEMLKRMVEDQGADFVSYDPIKGEWKIRVKHFSVYKLVPEVWFPNTNYSARTKEPKLRLYSLHRLSQHLLLIPPDYKTLSDIAGPIVERYFKSFLEVSQPSPAEKYGILHQLVDVETNVLQPFQFLIQRFLQAHLTKASVTNHSENSAHQTYSCRYLYLSTITFILPLRHFPFYNASLNLEEPNSNLHFTFDEVYVVICQLTCMLIYNLQVCYCTISSKEEFDARESLVIHSVDLNSLYGYEGPSSLNQVDG
ncbi:Nuclear pore complex protein NUP98A [Glycine soja]